MTRTIVLVLLAVLITTAFAGGPVNCIDECQVADSNAKMASVMKLKIAEHEQCVAEHKCPTIAPALSNMRCQGGRVGEYECNNVDLLAFVPLSELGCPGGEGNDIWGWTDPVTNREYAIMGCFDGTSFVDVTVPNEPQVIAFLPTYSYGNLFGDIKVYENHAYIVSEAKSHGMQVYDLTQLRGLTQPKSGVNIVKENTHYGEMGNTHNIVGNEETGFMYAVGTNTCNSGLHAIDVHDPLNPQFAGCFGDDGYVHDAQCVVYNGPDADYQGHEVCFCYNEDTLTIVDVEDKCDMKLVSRVPYDQAYYTHQGWLTEDQTYMLMNDEVDEMNSLDPRTRTLVWNVEDLDAPKHTGSFFSEKHATDHNLYTRQENVSVL